LCEDMTQFGVPVLLCCGPLFHGPSSAIITMT